MGLGAPSRRHFGDESGVVQPRCRRDRGLGECPGLLRGGGPAGKRLTSRPRLSCLGPGSFRHGRLCLQTLHQPLREPGEPGPLQHLEPGPRVSAGPRACAQAQSAPRPARPAPGARASLPSSWVVEPKASPVCSVDGAAHRTGRHPALRAPTGAGQSPSTSVTSRGSRLSALAPICGWGHAGVLFLRLY